MVAMRRAGGPLQQLWSSLVLRGEKAALCRCFTTSQLSDLSRSELDQISNSRSPLGWPPPWPRQSPPPHSRWYHEGLGGTPTGMRGTTVLCVRKGDKVVIIGDGQVTMGNQIMKPNVKKVRKIGANVIGGFAGATADAFTLFERLENKLEEHPGQLTRAAVELAKAWRTDKYLRRLDALMIVADDEVSLTITGTGDVVEPHDGVIGIGSGGAFALAAARALLDLPGMDAEAIAKKAMTIAADVCIYTNHNFTMEQLTIEEPMAPKSHPSLSGVELKEEGGGESSGRDVEGVDEGKVEDMAKSKEGGGAEGTGANKWFDFT